MTNFFFGVNGLIFDLPDNLPGAIKCPILKRGQLRLFCLFLNLWLKVTVSCF